jgi:hypothetical protein
MKRFLRKSFLFDIITAMNPENKKRSKIKRLQSSQSCRVIGYACILLIVGSFFYQPPSNAGGFWLLFPPLVPTAIISLAPITLIAFVAGWMFEYSANKIK